MEYIYYEAGYRAGVRDAERAEQKDQLGLSASPHEAR
jgi:hypothetical protein